MATMIGNLKWLRKTGKRSTSKEANNSPHEGGLTDPHVDVMEVPTPSLNEEVSIGEEQAVVFIETIDTSLGRDIVTSIEEGGATFGPIDDYEADDIATSSALLALATGAKDTGTSNGQDNTYVRMDDEDGAELAPMYDEESSPITTYDSYKEEEGDTLIYGNSFQLDVLGKRPLTPYDLEDRMLVTGD
jgi:hypothetical protein